jgi:hypothetical protein
LDRDQKKEFFSRPDSFFRRAVIEGKVKDRELTQEDQDRHNGQALDFSDLAYPAIMREFRKAMHKEETLEAKRTGIREGLRHTHKGHAVLRNRSRTQRKK